MIKIFLPFLTLFLISIVHSQSIWFSLDSTSSIPKMDKQGIWTSSDAVLAAALNQNNVLSIEQALSNSKNPDLKKVVEIKCNNCDFNQLTSDLNRSSSISGVEPGPNYQTLSEDSNINFLEDGCLKINSVSTDYNSCNFRCIVLSDSFTCTDTSVVLQLNIIDTLSKTV